MANDTRALVLSGGGTAGGAWMAGFVDGLVSNGVELGAADLIVGTSAGARTGAALAAGTLPDVAAAYREQRIPELAVPAGFDAFVAALMDAADGATDRAEAVRRIANLGPLGERLVPAQERRAMVAAHLPGDAWPARPLRITAVDADSGARLAFDAGSGVGLIDAATASGALPGIYPLVTIGGRRYADGGVHSPFNADLAQGHSTVLVITPLAIEAATDLLTAELDAVDPARRHVASADGEAIREIGPDPLDSARMSPAFAAGVAQADRAHADVAAVWNRAGSDRG